MELPNGTIAPDIYWFGNADIRYGDVRGNGRWNVNMSVQKDIPIFEKVRMQFSADASNLFNNTQFRPNMNAGTGATFTNLTAAQRAQVRLRLRVNSQPVPGAASPGSTFTSTPPQTSTLAALVYRMATPHLRMAIS